MKYLFECHHYLKRSIHWHGHQFNDKSYHFKIREEGIYRYDVGVDAHEYRWVNVDEIIDFLNK